MSPMKIAARLRSTITCPSCGHAEVEVIPPGSSLWAYGCKGCGTTLTPKPGDQCVFCSYGSVPCQAAQREMDVA